MEKKRCRGQNFSSDETLSLLDIVYKYKYIIENKTTNGLIIQEKVG